MERKREKGWCAVEGEREKERKNEREREREKREDVSAGILAPCHLWERDTSFSLDALLRFRIVTQPRRPSFTFYTSLLFFSLSLSLVFFFLPYLASSSSFYKENRCQCENVFLLDFRLVPGDIKNLCFYATGD